MGGAVVRVAVCVGCVAVRGGGGLRHVEASVSSDVGAAEAAHIEDRTANRTENEPDLPPVA